MKLVKDIALWNALRPRVAHRLPGRLRLRIPALKRLPEDDGRPERMLQRLMQIADGVTDVRLDRHTGSVLVQYDDKLTGDDDIVAYLSGVMALVRKHFDQFSHVPPDRRDALADRLEAWLRTVAHRRAFLHHKLTIPDDVWP
jgi:hypothetical protein